MKLTITIDLDNAAFEEPGELARILRSLALLSEDGLLTARNLRDSNGNTVGAVKVEE